VRLLDNNDFAHKLETRRRPDEFVKVFRRRDLVISTRVLASGGGLGQGGLGTKSSKHSSVSSSARWLREPPGCWFHHEPATRRTRPSKGTGRRAIQPHGQELRAAPSRGAPPAAEDFRSYDGWLEIDPLKFLKGQRAVGLGCCGFRRPDRSWRRPDEGTARLLFDGYQRAMPRQRASMPATDRRDRREHPWRRAVTMAMAARAGGELLRTHIRAGESRGDRALTFCSSSPIVGGGGTPGARRGDRGDRPVVYSASQGSRIATGVISVRRKAGRCAGRARSCRSSPYDGHLQRRRRSIARGGTRPDRSRVLRRVVPPRAARCPDKAAWSGRALSSRWWPLPRAPPLAHRDRGGRAG